MSRHGSDDASLGASCLALVIWLALGATVGGACFDYVLASVLGKDVPWFADAAGGAVTSGFIITAAVVCWIVKLCGVPVPFVGL